MNGLGNALERVLSRLFDTQGPAETQVAQNIEHEVVAPFRQVFRLGPVIAVPVGEQLIPTINVLLDEESSGPY